ncbi:MAG: FixH family protein [Actinomycetota bacterium]|nr:FixH family protein [Actinomycetota bacterium]
MRRIWRLGVVATVAATAFAFAIARFSDAAAEGCAQRVKEHPSYQVVFIDQPRVGLSTYRLLVSRADGPVTGAEVCLNSYMQGMSAMATTDTGVEVAPGTYEMSLTFQMGGPWLARVLITEPGKPVAAVLLTLQVAEEDDTGMGDGATTTVASTTTTTTTLPPTTVATTTTEVPADATEAPTETTGTVPDAGDAPPGSGQPGAGEDPIEEDTTVSPGSRAGMPP